MSGLGYSKCWNCGSMKYHQTISVESCSDCGIKFNYHSGERGNEAYNNALEAKYYREKIQEEEEMERYYEETYGVDYRGNPV